MLTDDTLRKVRETARIDEVASGYLTLHRSGKDFVALCPFHDERHPSFRVSPARNIGKCFSCGEAADPIRLVCHMEGCGFEEAVRLLARGPRHRPIQAGRAAVPPLRLGTQLLPRLRPPPRLLLPAGRRHEPFPRRLRQGHRLQPLHQRAERRQPGALPGDAGTALPRDRTDLLIPKKQQLI